MLSCNQENCNKSTDNKYCFWHSELNKVEYLNNIKSSLFMNIIQSPSPNFSPSNHKKIGMQIHKTLGLMPWTLRWLQNPVAQASAHLLFARNGDIHQLVQFGNRSWSAGRISNPSLRAKKIMKKDWLGRWVKPGHYLIQSEFECLSNQTFTEKQYESVVWVCENILKAQLDIEITDENLIEHQDTASGKPELDPERTEILRRLEKIEVPPIEDDRESIKKEIRRLLDKL